MVKKLADIAEMRFCISTGNQDVNNVDKTVRNVTKNLVHHSLKCASSVPQTKRHPDPLEQAKRSYDCRLQNVSFALENLVI